MKHRIVKQYICDFCGKKGLSAGHMGKHERHCTMNPDRKCRMCILVSGVQPPMKELLILMPKPKVEIINDEFWEHEKCLNIEEGKEAVKIISKETENCPMCTYAVIRQRGWHPQDIFDYKKECATFWNEYNKEQAIDDY